MFGVGRPTILLLWKFMSLNDLCLPSSLAVVGDGQRYWKILPTLFDNSPTSLLLICRPPSKGILNKGNNTVFSGAGLGETGKRGISERNEMRQIERKIKTGGDNLACSFCHCPSLPSFLLCFNFFFSPPSLPHCCLPVVR